MHRSTLVVVCVTLALPALHAQETAPPLAFPVEATTVRLSIGVTAQLKVPLTNADFTVYDNGKKQDIAFFDAQSLPMDISLFVDTSGSLSVREMLSGIIRLRPGIAQGAKRFVDILKPGDRMEVADFSSRILTLQALTEDKDLLRFAIDRLDIPCTPEQQEQSVLCTGGDRTLLSRALYLKLYELKRAARDPEHPRRRVLVFITDGIDTGRDFSEDTLRKSARQAEASIYVLALQPNDAIGQSAQEMSANAQSRWLMQQLCQETGGAFLPAMTPFELSGLAKRVSAEIATEYTIGWVPVDAAGKDSWHTIQVAVRNVPANRLRYRNGYLSAKP